MKIKEIIYNVQNFVCNDECLSLPFIIEWKGKEQLGFFIYECEDGKDDENTEITAILERVIVDVSSASYEITEDIGEIQLPVTISYQQDFSLDEIDSLYADYYSSLQRYFDNHNCSEKILETFSKIVPVDFQKIYSALGAKYIRNEDSAEHTDTPMIRNDFLGLLAKVTVICRDNGKHFTKTDRLTAIKGILANSKSQYILTEGKLFNIYTKKPLSEFNGDESIILVSSHVDCDKSIIHCFSEETNNSDVIKGTYDNSITNATILSLMIEDKLNDNVIVAFTGDEEEDSNGAKEVIKELSKYNFEYVSVVLDVTNQGWEASIDFTIENNFWSDKIGKKIVETASLVSSLWRFVPSDLENVPKYVPNKNLITEEALADESWEYDEGGIQCFSFCLPVGGGEMHSNEGVLARYSSIEKYITALSKIITCLQI